MKAKPSVKAIQVKMDTYHLRLVATLAQTLDLDVSKVIRRAIREMAKKNKID